MIKINLTPIEELENPYWWIYDLAWLVAVLVLGFFGAQFYLSEIEDKILEVRNQIINVESEIATIKPDANQYDTLRNQVQDLEQKKFALQKITESKLVRYLPIILLENLQVLKPDGLWFQTLKLVDSQVFDDGQNGLDEQGQNNGLEAQNTSPQVAQDTNGPVRIEITGRSMSNSIIAEFMTAIKSTQNQAFDKSDIRTRIFFQNVQLSFSEVAAVRLNNQQKNVVAFKLVMSFKEREKNAADLDMRLSNFIDDFRRNGRAIMR